MRFSCAACCAPAARRAGFAGAVRRAAFEGLYSTYKSYSATIPAIYGASVKADVFYAHAAKHESALAARLFPDAVPEEVYTNLIKSVHRHLPVLNEYIARKGEQIGVNDMGMEDVYVPACKGFDIKLPFDEAYELMMSCLHPLGEDYQAVLRRARPRHICWCRIFSSSPAARSLASSCRCGWRHGAIRRSITGLTPSSMQCLRRWALRR